MTPAEIMEDWQIPLMEAMADAVTESHGRVLEIGFGRGVAADLIQEREVAAHVVVEMNPHVVSDFYEPWRAKYPDRDIRLVAGRWQDHREEFRDFDGIFFHAFPMNEREVVEQILESITYAEHAIPDLAAMLREGGVLTYLTAEIDSLGRAHQRLLFDHFREVRTRILELDVPPDTADTWWADRMVVVRAIR